MYVKSVTLRGFKSFASATTMQLEPGITCIVGPNGSGKSNVVDALAWVMGEQGAKSLRGGKMEDVIFAGTARRPPLGRAEVSLTIDNTDGALPIDYAEVTIARTMFRNGGSDYSINGTACRLLDVQELLSDSGIGREMHIIVGQGQLDTVLRATPEDRRGFIEEAAGVLKHRKRKERALRKLDAMEGNLTRVNDLTGEIRRQLGPLGRQAETARKATVIQADVRDARLRIMADDMVQLTSALEQEIADETALVARRTGVEEKLAGARAELARLEQEGADAAPQLTRAQDRWYALSALVERLAATSGLATERVRLLTQEDDEPSGSAPQGRDPDDLRDEAAGVREQEEGLAVEIDEAARALQAAVDQRGEAETAHQGEQQRLTRLARAAADRREGLAKLAGQVAARRSRIEAAEAEVGRLQRNATQIRERSASAEQEYARHEARVLDEEEGEEGLDGAYEQATADLERAETEVERWREEQRAAESERASLAARREALELSLLRKDGAAALLDPSTPDGAGIVGSVASLLTVESGHQSAVAAALGWAADALVVESVDAAASALATLRDSDAGRAGLLVPRTAGSGDPTSWPELPDHARWARDVVTCSEEVRPAIEQLLERVALVPDAQAASALAQASAAEDGVAAVTAVTANGDVFAPGYVHGGSATAPSLIEVQAALDETQERLASTAHRGEQAGFALSRAQSAVAGARERAESTLERLHESDARMAAVAERVGQLGAQLRAARQESDRTQVAISSAEEALESNRAELTELEQRLAAAEEDPGEQEPGTEERDRLAAVAARARSEETELRLTLRTREERAHNLKGRADALEAAARSQLAARERAAARRERRRQEARTARAVGEGAQYVLEVVNTVLEVAARRRDAVLTEREDREQALDRGRSHVAALGEDLRELTDSVHRDEVARAQQQLRVEALETRAVEELGIGPEALVGEYGPHQPVPPVGGAEDDAEGVQAPEPQPFVREAQEKRLRSAERKLSALGKVNPLALEEYAALEERHQFLVEQLEDLKQSKRDLLDIVREVDERVEAVFSEAFADTAAQFERVFDRLFPGGEGRLTLTDPDNVLTTGIEVEARPPGKKIKRLSLLSGGERSLTAVALLVAIFKARPSPFYIMDEVDAALDDTNLGRLLTLFEELRDSSQLIVITHQKRTMEVADALYGVSMRGDGVTTVVSQRLRDLQEASA